MKVRVYHGYYGCDTGCCGHIVELEDGRQEFEFVGYYDSDGDKRAWARDLAEQIIRRRWPECVDSIDWSTMDVEDVRDCGGC